MSNPSICFPILPNLGLIHTAPHSNPLGEGHHGPLPVPSPFPGARITASALHLLQLLILPGLQAHHDVRLASPQREDVDPRSRAKRPNSILERRGRVPGNL